MPVPAPGRYASDRVVAVRTIYAGRSMVRMCIRPSISPRMPSANSCAPEDRHDRGQKREPGDRRTAQQEAPNDEGQHPESEQREGEADEGCSCSADQTEPRHEVRRHGGRAIGTDSSTLPDWRRSLRTGTAAKTSSPRVRSTSIRQQRAAVFLERRLDRPAKGLERADHGCHGAAGGGRARLWRCGSRCSARRRGSVPAVFHTPTSLPRATVAAGFSGGCCRSSSIVTMTSWRLARMPHRSALC